MVQLIHVRSPSTATAVNIRL